MLLRVMVAILVAFSRRKNKVVDNVKVLLDRHLLKSAMVLKATRNMFNNTYRELATADQKCLLDIRVFSFSTVSLRTGNHVELRDSCLIKLYSNVSTPLSCSRLQPFYFFSTFCVRGEALNVPTRAFQKEGKTNLQNA